MKYNYQARTKTGEIQSGIIEASNRDAAIDTLKKKGFYVTAVQLYSVPAYAKKINLFSRTSRKDIVMLSRQLAIMFKSRVPLIEVFQTLAKQTKNQDLKEKILRIAEEVEGGSTLSSALAVFPKTFNSFYVSMVKSGEATGKLTEVFLYLADYLEKEHNLRSKLVGAMIYPGFILVVFLAVFSILITFVIPQLASVLKEMNQELPLMTRIAIGISDFFVKYWMIFLMAIASLVILAIVAIKNKILNQWFQRIVLKIPGVNGFMKKIYLTRFAMNISTLLSGGIPIAQALEITADVVGSVVYREIILSVRDEVRKGEQMSAVLQNYPNLITPLFYQMIVVGEKTGTLDTSLENVVEFYEKEVERGLDNFVRLLEPAFIVVLALIVGGLVASVMMPIYSSMGNFQ
jgi:type IV pilus assembly protein PilC